VNLVGVWELGLEMHALAYPDRPYDPDFLDLLRALLAADARFTIVGAYAAGVHGRPRAAKDLGPSGVQARGSRVRRRQESPNVIGVVPDDVGLLPDRQLGD
jgi:hypothetical protein